MLIPLLLIININDWKICKFAFYGAYITEWDLNILDSNKSINYLNIEINIKYFILNILKLYNITKNWFCYVCYKF